MPIRLGGESQKDCYLTAYFYRKAGGGVRQAIVATAHKILVIAYHVLRDGTVYQELGGGFFDQLHHGAHSQSAFCDACNGWAGTLPSHLARQRLPKVNSFRSHALLALVFEGM
jgi:hypothetical protein